MPTFSAASNLAGHPAETMRVDFTRPILLQPLNALPLSRTPWAGQDIYPLLGDDLKASATPPRLGECWEFSCDPQYPSRVVSTQMRLDTAIAADPQAALASELVEQRGPYCQLLVKLINAARPLSVQLHPELSATAPLAGKWESWLVLAAAQDSKAYVGFNAPLSRAQLREKINADSLTEHLATIALHPDSYLEIPPHTVHALGAGAVVLEVQHLLHGRGGETLRLWDWGHKYNDAGELDWQHGQARPLALARALPLINPAAQQRDTLHPRILPSAQKHLCTQGLEILQRSNNPYYCVFTLTAKQHTAFNLHIVAGYGIMLCWRGAWQLGTIKINCYQPLFLPAKLGKMEVVCEKNSAAVVIVPAGVKLNCWLD